MSINKTFLTITLSIISIATINTAAASWCGYVPSTPNCGTNTLCLSTAVSSAERQCIPTAKKAAYDNPKDQNAFANYTNLSYYFRGVYDYYGLHPSTALPKQPGPSTSVNIVGACYAYQNGNQNFTQLCKDAVADIVNPDFVVPTAPAPTAATPPPVVIQTAAQCYAAADQVYKTSAVYLLLVAAMPKVTPADASGCAGTTNQATCSKTVQNVCNQQKKSHLIYCTEPTMTSMVIGCQ